jgi:hypothetical protein
MRSKFILFASALLVSGAASAQFTVGTGGQKFVVVEEMTGVWCGYCPPGGDYLNKLVNDNPKAIGIAVHDNNNSTLGDPNASDMMEIKEGATIAKTTGYNNGYPSGPVDRVKQPNGKAAVSPSAWAGIVTARQAVTPKFDVVMNHKYDPTSKLVTVKLTVTALEALTGEYNVNVMFIEDGIKSEGSGYQQKSFLFKEASSAYYHKGTPNADSSVALLSPADYTHNHVLRAVLGDTWGTTGVITKDPAANSVFTKEYTYTLPAGFNVNKLKLIGLVQKHNTADALARDIVNAVEAVFMPFAVNVEEANKQITKVELFPNPASNNLTVRAYLNTPGEVNVSVANAVGQTMISRTFNESSNMLSENIALDNLSNGIYFVTVSSNGANQVEKIIVNK